MTEWQVVGVIIALAGLVSGVVAPIVKLNTTIIKLTTIVDGLAKQLSEMANKSSATHRDLYSRVNDHEKRIVVLEDHDKKKE